MYNVKYMEMLFESINFDLFEDKLDKPRFFVLDEELAFTLWPNYAIDGICVPHKDFYLVGVQKDLKPHHFFDTLVHELIHVYLMEKCNYSGHGKKFKKMCEKAIDIYYPV